MNYRPTPRRSRLLRCNVLPGLVVARLAQSIPQKPGEARAGIQAMSEAGQRRMAFQMGRARFAQNLEGVDAKNGVVRVDQKTGKLKVIRGGKA